MKQILKYALIPLFIFLANTSLKATSYIAKQDSTVTLHVAGNCGMCKKRIETAAKMHGVETAVWNAGDNLLQINYNPQKVQLEQYFS